MEELKRIRLGELYDAVGRVHPRNSDEKYWFIDISAIDKDTKKITKPKFMAGKKIPETASQLIRENDVLISTNRPELNTVAIVQKEHQGAVCCQQLNALRPNKDILPDYLFYLLQYQRTVQEITALTEREYVRTYDLKDYMITVPGIREQTRIAGSIKDFLDKVNSAACSFEELRQISRELPFIYLESAAKVFPKIALKKAARISYIDKRNNYSESAPIPFVLPDNISGCAEWGAFGKIESELIKEYGFGTDKKDFFGKVFKIDCTDMLNKEYFFYLMLSAKRPYRGKSYMEDLLLPLPSIGRQKLIAEQMTELFNIRFRIEEEAGDQIELLRALPQRIIDRTFDTENGVPSREECDAAGAEIHTSPEDVLSRAEQKLKELVDLYKQLR